MHFKYDLIVRDAKNKEKKANREATKGNFQSKKENSTLTITTLKDNNDINEKSGSNNMSDRLNKMSTCCQ